MCNIKALLLFVIVGMVHFSCTSDDIGSRINPGYDEYLKRRTSDQKREDERMQEEARMNRLKRKNDDETIKRFNEEVKLKAPAAANTTKDAVNSLKGK